MGAVGEPLGSPGMKLGDVPTPALVVDRAVFDHNVATMAGTHAGRRLRPHVKAFKSTALARELAAAGHDSFCCATIREIEGMAAAGLGTDLLLANEVLDCARLGAIVARDAGGTTPGTARVTVAVDSVETIEAAAAGGLAEVVIDVSVGMPRCGCDPADAGRLADRARERGLSVRGVMGYEGHLMREERERKVAEVEVAMKLLLEAHDQVGGDIVSGGGTGTYDCNPWVTELQAGSYCLMDTEYLPHAPAFRIALNLWTTVISVNPGGWAVVDGGSRRWAWTTGTRRWPRPGPAGTSPTSTRSSAPARIGRCGSVTACGSCRPTSTPPWPCTSGCGWSRPPTAPRPGSTPTPRWSTSGRSTCGAGDEGSRGRQPGGRARPPATANPAVGIGGAGYRPR